jgi:hypothetical protein
MKEYFSHCLLLNILFLLEESIDSTFYIILKNLY